MMKVSELSGAELDYWVANADDLAVSRYKKLKYPDDVYWVLSQDGINIIHYEEQRDNNSMNRRYDEYPYSPSTNWQQGGPLIEKYEMTFGKTIVMIDGRHVRYWARLEQERTDTTFEREGKTHLIAAMRCIVSSVYGEEVDDESRRPSISRKRR